MFPEGRLLPNHEFAERQLGQVPGGRVPAGHRPFTSRSNFRKTTTADAFDRVCMKWPAWWAIPAHHGRRSVFRQRLDRSLDVYGSAVSGGRISRRSINRLAFWKCMVRRP
jgi:hypothetical protein